MNYRALRALPFILALAFLAAGVGETVAQRAEDEYVATVAREALRDAPGDDLVSKVTTLRDYLRTHVRNIEFYAKTRPFLRDSAAETLRMGKGRCGEATRAFINMARAAGIPAQRLYLEGGKPHVVAVVKTEDGTSLLVDSADTPVLERIEPLSQLTSRTRFTSYSTLGWRRLRLLRKLPSNELSLGPFGYLLENPHALTACLLFLSSAASLSLGLVLGRKLSRLRSDDPEQHLTVPPSLEGGRAEA